MFNGYNPTKLNQLFRNPFPAIGNFFKNAFAQTAPQVQSVQLFAPVPAMPQSYQIKAGDTFPSIAKQFGVEEGKLQSTNKMLVPPPKGSYISLDVPVKPLTPQARLVNQGVPSTVAAAMTGSALSDPYSQAQVNQFGAGTDYAGTTPETRGHVSLGEVQAHLMSQIASGKAPVAVPNQLLASFGETPQSMIAAGYTYNTAAQEWTLASAGAGAQQDDPNKGKVYFSRSRGFVTPEVERLLLRRRARRREKRRAGPQASNAGVTPVTTLDVHVGSG